jgi:hypothetical protein
MLVFMAVIRPTQLQICVRVDACCEEVKLAICSASPNKRIRRREVGDSARTWGTHHLWNMNMRLEQDLLVRSVVLVTNHEMMGGI